MRFASHECRWFFEGPLAGAREVEIVDAFRGAGGWPVEVEVPRPEWPEAWRRDRYVCLPVRVDPREVDMGIKLRDERASGGGVRLEYKARTSIPGPVGFDTNAVGIVERWLKWSYADAEVPGSLLAPFVTGEIGLGVEKIRMLRKIRFDAGDRDEEIAPSGAGSFVDRGLTIELARIRTEAYGEHWSLGFEAYPPDPEMHEDFVRNVRAFAAGLPPAFVLTAERSMSYPEWLSRL